MKLITVDMTRQTTRTDEVPKAYLGLGGRGLTSTMINAQVPPTCDPLVPDNKLIIAPGTLSGTSLVNTSRVPNSFDAFSCRGDLALLYTI